MKINRKLFFDTYRSNFGKLTQPLVNNINDILKAIDDEPLMQDKRYVGYTFGTAKIESNDTFAPVVEGYWIKSNRLQKLYNYYKNNNPGALKTIFPHGAIEPAYYGRGRITQTTHIGNYLKASMEIFGDNRLVNDPDIILKPDIDMKVAFKGMLEGWFTGKKLSDYFNNNRTDYYNARKIINGIVPMVTREIARASELIAAGVEFVDDAEAMAGYNQDEYLA